MKNSPTNANPSGREIQSGGNHNEFRNLISHFWNFFDTPSAESELEPKIEVRENKNSVTVSAELPGIAKAKKTARATIFRKFLTECSDGLFPCPGIWTMKKLMPIMTTAC